MALSGVHVVCGNINVANGASLLGAVSWSQTMGSAGTTALPAPNGSSMTFEVRALTADVWIATGPNPDPTNGPRIPLAVADGSRNILAFPGDRLAWIAA